MTQEVCVGLSATQFWEKYFIDEAEFGFDKFMQHRGEQNVTVTPWAEPASTEEATFLGMTAKKMRQLSMVVQVKGNPFVKECPTTKTYYLLEQSETKLHILCRNNTKDVPYCDTFQVLDELLFVSPEASSQPIIKSGALRQSFSIQWLKSTMMKGMIRGNVDTETKAV